MTTDNESPQGHGRKPPSPRVGEKVRAHRASVYLGLGSNLGDREANLREAIERIEALGLDVVRASSIYETEPVGYADQSWFLNQVIEARVAPGLSFNAGEGATVAFRTTAGDPSGAFMPQAAEMLRALHKIEDEMGRKRTILNGPRVIDIDILFFPEAEGFTATTRTAEDDSGRNAGHAMPVIPHPRMHERRFVLQPLCEIAPDLTYPGLNKTFCEMLAALDDPSTVRIYKRGEQAKHS
ncbi:MAG TPA: 2-amino-4-hydroxy-6-hydroxymethyldihydropteridine diphosphokinase [Blastocatellia bacterium]|nr:2-amino-4-hydroxy-6-hydroxymethyldihydropteridine diphosphokinase [Blastocatellia bacterium]